MKKRILILVILVGIFSGCVSVDAVKTQDQWEREARQSLQSVNVSDGIAEDEAKIVSNNYFLKYKEVSGGWGNPVSDGDYWQIQQLDCFSGEPLGGDSALYIHKNTGKITWSDGPTIYNPLEIWK